jgi:CheY-like chemotaxis protein
MKDRSLLLVDHDPGVLKAVSWPLEDGGYHLSLAVNGRAAIERLREKDFDLDDLMCRVLAGSEGWTSPDAPNQRSLNIEPRAILVQKRFAGFPGSWGRGT